MNNYFIMLPVCLLVKGFSRTAIYDIQREEIDFLPNDLYEFVLESNKKSLQYIKGRYIAYWDIVEEYIDYLVDNEYAIIGTKKDMLGISDISAQYSYYGSISNCICEYSHLNNENIKAIVYALNSLGCSAFQLLSLKDKISIESLKRLLDDLNDLKLLHHIELIIPYNNYEIKDINNILYEYPLVNRFVIHSAPYDQINNNEDAILIFTRQIVASCGMISRDYFSLNLYHVAESQNYNTCFNRKLAIDKNGNIKNCPFSNKTFGNILTANINNIINGEDFKNQWNIKKDQIEVCKDCEFRHICTDCRVFIKDKDNIYSQPARCTYNPYIGKWKNEDGFCSVEESLKKIDQ